MAGKQVDPRGQGRQLRPGTYSDGHPLDEVHYLQCKLILKPDRFVSPSSFHDYAKLVRQAAEKHDIEFSIQGFKDLSPRIREVVFFDTKDFSLYNHAFILRRRITYEQGFPVGEPEIVFKFRHPDLQGGGDGRAAEDPGIPNQVQGGSIAAKGKTRRLPATVFPQCRLWFGTRCPRLIDLPWRPWRTSFRYWRLCRLLVPRSSTL